MKLEHFYLYLVNNFFIKLHFLKLFIIAQTNIYFINIFSKWVISNYSDTYWFLYSNKKSLYELRYL